VKIFNLPAAQSNAGVGN